MVIASGLEGLCFFGGAEPQQKSVATRNDSQVLLQLLGGGMGRLATNLPSWDVFDTMLSRDSMLRLRLARPQSIASRWEEQNLVTPSMS